MHSKIYKAKLISLHSQNNADGANAHQPSDAIHARFGMLHHIFQRNKYVRKNLQLSGRRIAQTERSPAKENTKRQRASGKKIDSPGAQ